MVMMMMMMMMMMIAQIRRKQVTPVKKMSMRLQQATKRLLRDAQRNKGDFMTRMWRKRTETVAQG